MADKHPTINQTFAKLGLKQLTKRQREIWEYMSLDGLTQDQIAIKLHISQPVVSKHIAAGRKRMSKWFKDHENVYDLMASELAPRAFDDRDNGVREAKDTAAKTPIRRSIKD
jgi:DNA-binding CsgD family transcriptional regulator